MRGQVQVFVPGVTASGLGHHAAGLVPDAWTPHPTGARRLPRPRHRLQHRS